MCVCVCVCVCVSWLLYLFFIVVVLFVFSSCSSVCGFLKKMKVENKNIICNFQKYNFLLYETLIISL